MDDIEDLRRRVREAESRAEEERRRRKEEQRRRKEERRRRKEEKRRREEEQRRREEEQRRREEEQRRREAAEELATASQPQTLEQYLETCHSLQLAIQVLTDPSSTTQGETTNPTGRVFPRRIVPWDDFDTRQAEIWDDLVMGDLFSLPAFPSNHQMEYVKSMLRPIGCELGLRHFEREVIENAVQMLVDRANTDPLLRSRLGLKGTVSFESHTNLGPTDDPISEPMKHMSPGRGSAGSAATSSALKPPSTPKPRRRARGKGNRADQYCIYRTSTGKAAPALAIEYKAPHKLSVDQLVTGLESEIQPERDVINKDGQGFDFAARRLAAAVVTQLFSYMIGKGLQYGYVCTGQALVFLHIPADPSMVYFSVCVPDQDVMDDDQTRLHRTAVAQVFAFVLQALRATSPSEKWHDDAKTLDIWAVEYDDVLRKIPISERKRKTPRASPFKSRRWKGYNRSPIRTRSGCRPPAPNIRPPEDDEEGPPSPTPKRPRTGRKASAAGTGSRGVGKHGQDRDKQQHLGPATKPDIRSRPFCTSRCLLGLAYGGPTDESCPNADCHGQEHINRLEFLRLAREQLATDRGSDADCAAMHLYGSCGSLFKVRLSSHGYTLVAKGFEGLDLDCMQHEYEIYDRLRPIQGQHVPVCLGTLDLVRPCHYDGGVFEHFLFLSWAGQPLSRCTNEAVKAGIHDGVSEVFKAIHKLRVLHRDAEPRNMLCDIESGKVMVVDFERAEFRGRQPLGLVANTVLNRKRKRETSQKQKDDFARELEWAVKSTFR